METYTKLTCEIKGPNGDRDINSVTITDSDWGMDMEDMFSMMRRMALALDYHPDTVKQYFEPEENCEIE